MKHAGCLAVSALLLFAAAPPGHADGRFDQKLPPDRQVVHVLNRLTFGPRPGDVDQVRRIGLDAWVDRQLHPDRLAENAALGDRLRALLVSFDAEKRGLVIAGAPPQVTEGLPAELVQDGLNTRKAEQEARQKEIRRLMPPLNELLSPEQIRTANNGSLDDRRALLDSLD